MLRWRVFFDIPILDHCLWRSINARSKLPPVRSIKPVPFITSTPIKETYLGRRETPNEVREVNQDRNNPWRPEGRKNSFWWSFPSETSWISLTIRLRELGVSFTPISEGGNYYPQSKLVIYKKLHAEGTTWALRPNRLWLPVGGFLKGVLSEA